MFKHFFIKSILSLFLLLFTGVFSVSQEHFVNDTAMARKYLRERGEVYFSFSVPTLELRRLSNIVSVDSYSDGRAFANANSEEFELFLREALEFTVYTPPGEWYREKRRVEGLWNYYPTYPEYVDMMQSWADDYPEICEYVDAGATVEGRRILFLRITGKKSNNEPKPAFMYSSTMHGDETVGYVLLLRLIEYLLANYSENGQVERLLDDIEIWINPLANPDGTYFGGDGNTIVSPKRRNANNIDLNRNFPVPGSPDYTKTDREPETAIMMELIESGQFVLSANLHGGTEVMNYPWDLWGRRHADDAWFRYICREYADTAMHYSPPGYMTFLGGVTNGYDWYSVTGSRQDYVTYFTGGREVTIEISMDKHPPPDSLPGYWDYNVRSLLNYMEQAMFGIRGYITDAITGAPVVDARIEIKYHDNDSSQVFSDQSTGWYFRLINEGTYNMRFSAEGYNPLIVEDVEVRNRKVTRLDAQMEPVFVKSDITLKELEKGLSIYPLPARDIVNIRIDLPRKAPLHIDIYDQSGRKLTRIYRGWAVGEPKHISFSTFDIPGGTYIIRMKYGSSYISRRFIITGW